MNTEAAHWLSREEMSDPMLAASEIGFYVHLLSGEWYSTDESYTELFGPFATQDAARRWQHDYARSL